MVDPIYPPSAPQPLTSVPRAMMRGDTFSFPIAVKTATGAPYNLTGATLWSTVKRAWAEPDSLALARMKTPSSGIVVTDAVNGKAIVTMPAAATIDMGDGPVTLVYDVQLRAADGVTITTIEIGTIECWPDATRTII